MRNVLLSIAGFDPTSGAGVSLDLRVFELLGFQGMAVLTTVTSQNTAGVRRVHCLSPALILEQHKILAEDVAISGIKVGMLGSREAIRAVRRIFLRNSEIPRVVDPVFKSSSGKWLFDRSSIPDYISAIRARASLLTPNLKEASLITGQRIESLEEMKKAAARITSHARIPCLLKGGQFAKKMVSVLYDGSRFHLFEKEKLARKVHGTGCFLSSSLLAYLCRGHSLEKACWLATELTHEYIRKARRVGRGQHLFSF